MTSKEGVETLVLDNAKIVKIFQSCTFWTTFLVLKYVKSLKIKYIKNRFGQLCKIAVVQNE